MKLLLQIIFVSMSMTPMCLSSNDDDILPSMVIAILVRNKAHTLPYFLTLLDEQDYDKSRLGLYVKSDHNQDESSEILRTWIDARGSEYHHVKMDIDDEVYKDERPFEWDEKRFRRIIELKEEALDYGRKIWADYLLFLDADVFLTNNQTFREFTSRPELSLSAPLLKTLSSYSNFWAGMTENFYYNRTDEYFPILDRNKVGCFAVPMVHSCVFVNLNKVQSKSLTFKPENIENQIEKPVPRDDIITFALSAKLAGAKLHICNLERLSEFGYLMNPLEEEEDLLDDHDNLVNLKLQIISQTKVLKPQSIFDPYLLPKYHRPDTLHMDQVYLINLKRRPDRYEKMIACFKELGIDFKLIEAVDGQQITDKYLIENGIEPLPLFRDPHHKRPMKLGEIGCFMSHYLIWQDVIANNYQKILIFEDDILFEPEFRQNFESLLEELQHIKVNWDLVYLGRKILHNADDRWVPKSKQLVRVDYTYWTLSYMLSQSGARKLVDEKPLGKMLPVDEYIPIMYDRHPNETWKSYFRNRNLQAFSAQPRLVHPTHYTGEKGYISDTEDSEIVDQEEASHCEFCVKEEL